MLTVLVSVVASVGVAWLALSVIMREFRGHGVQIAAALSFDERSYLGGDFRPAAPRQARLAPARMRTQPMRRAAA